MKNNSKKLDLFKPTLIISAIIMTSLITYTTVTSKGKSSISNNILAKGHKISSGGKVSELSDEFWTSNRFHF